MNLRIIDLFCGIGGFRVAVNQTLKKYGVNPLCVFSSDNDPYCQQAYYENFGDKPSGDIQQINAESIPDHDMLFAGFPCQPFSIIGNGRGFEDTRGTLFFHIARILDEKRPKFFILENVKRLVSHNRGHTFRRILETLSEMGYHVDYRVLNALDYGLPQKRERVFIVGFYKTRYFQWPKKKTSTISLAEILEENVDTKYYASKYIKDKRKAKHTPTHYPSIWHENKSGNISSYPFSCALRANASHNYLLVNGERRLIPREMLRLQGFPDSFKIVVPDSQVKKQAGNAVPVNLVEAIMESFVPIILNEFEADQKVELSRNQQYSKSDDEEKNTAFADG